MQNDNPFYANKPHSKTAPDPNPKTKKKKKNVCVHVRTESHRRKRRPGDVKSVTFHRSPLAGPTKLPTSTGVFQLRALSTQCTRRCSFIKRAQTKKKNVAH